MKKLPLLFLVPMIALIVALGVATAVKLLPPPETEVTQTAEYPNPFAEDTASQPSTFLGKLFNPPQTPSPTPASSLDLSNELKTTVDDGGKSDFDALEQEASAL